MASTLSYVGYVLALVGGIIIILLGVLDLLGSAFRLFSIPSFLRGTAYALVHIVIGAACIIGSKYVSKLVWGILLLILGIIVGNIGGSLVIIGALLGLVSTLIKSGPKIG